MGATDRYEVEKMLKEAKEESKARKEKRMETTIKKRGSIDKERLFNFLKDDLENLEQDIKENNKENIENFFYYWKQHINDLNK